MTGFIYEYKVTTHFIIPIFLCPFKYSIFNLTIATIRVYDAFKTFNRFTFYQKYMYGMPIRSLSSFIKEFGEHEFCSDDKVLFCKFCKVFFTILSNTILLQITSSSIRHIIEKYANNVQFKRY